MSQEWKTWCDQWREELPRQDASPLILLERSVAHHRRLAQLFTAIDVTTAAVMSVGALAVAIEQPLLPVVVWAGSVGVFSLVLVALLAWNRRDALFLHHASATSFLAQYLTRLRGRARVPRLILVFAAIEMAYSLALVALWVPARIVPIGVLFGVVAASLVAWSTVQARRLRAERARVEALRRELENEST